MPPRFGHIDYRKNGLFKGSKKRSSTKTQEFDTEHNEGFMETPDALLERRKKRDSRVQSALRDKIEIESKDKAVGKFVYGDVLDSKKRRQSKT